MEKKNLKITAKSGFISRDGKGSGACALGGNAVLRGLRHQEFAQISPRFKTGWFHKEMGARVLFVRDITHEGRRERFLLLIDTHFCMLLMTRKPPAPSLFFILGVVMEKTCTDKGKKIISSLNITFFFFSSGEA